MIKSIVLKNFMSHKDSYLELDPGLNVITGDNEAGKSNVLRGIDWIVNNRPSGDSMCSHWGGETMAGVIVDGKLVQRYRLENGQNLYTITHESGEEEEFRAFGRGVPDEIRQLLNIIDVNMHSQMDGPFLLSQSPADVARYFNEIVNLDVIDRAIKGIAKILSKDKAELSHEIVIEERLREGIKEYDWLADAEGCIVKLEATQNQTSSLGRDVDTLSGWLAVIAGLETRLSSLDEIIEHEEAVISLIEGSYDIAALEKDCDKLSKLLDEVYELELEANKHQDMIAFDDEVNILIEMKDKVDTGAAKIRELHRLLTTQRALQEDLEFASIHLLDLQRAWDELMPDTCPLCGK